MKRRALLTLTALMLAISLLPAAATAGITEDECGDEYTPIYEIQGDSSSSPYHGDTVTTEGIVTVDLQRTSEIRGFFLQDPKGDRNPETSDGVFVYAQDSWGFDVEVGDHIRIVAEVDENFGDTELEWVDDVVVCDTDQEVKKTRINVREFRADAESFEGMYVTFEQALFVTDTYNLHRFGEVWLGDDGVIEQPTNEYPGGSDEMQELADDNMDQSILLDDGSRYRNPSPVPFLHANGTLRVGDRTHNLTGAIHYSFGQYRIQTQDEAKFAPLNHRPKAPKVDGDIVVASFNVLNYWTTLGGRGAWNADQLAVQQEKLVAAIIGMDADIVGLQEIENDTNCGDNDGIICDHTPTQTLVAALNAEMGADVWAWVGAANHYNNYPIRNEIIYPNDRVSTVGDSVALAHPAFDTFKTPGVWDSQLGRPPLAQTFDAGGEVFTVVVNHFKSKGSSCSGIGDPDAGDGQGNCNLSRVAQAEAVLDFVDALVVESGDDDVLVIGDLNAYFQEDPVLALEADLSNILSMFDENPYSFDFFATFAFPYVGRGAIDHALGTASIAAQTTDAMVWHINADEPRLLDWYDTGTVAPGPYRSSDHDPVLIGLTLGE